MLKMSLKEGKNRQANVLNTTYIIVMLKNLKRKNSKYRKIFFFYKVKIVDIRMVWYGKLDSRVIWAIPKQIISAKIIYFGISLN